MTLPRWLWSARITCERSNPFQTHRAEGDNLAVVIRLRRLSWRARVGVLEDYFGADYFGTATIWTGCFWCIDAETNWDLMGVLK